MSRHELMRDVTAKAGACLKSFFGKKLDIKKKGLLDLVTQADEAAEALIVSAITAAFPDDGIQAEEGGGHRGSSSFKWIVDPLDGTTNFAHSVPHFAVSIALAEGDQVIHGIVFNPISGEWFEALAGEGATLNGAPLRVSDQQDLGEALAATGFSYDRRQRMPVLLERVQLILLHCQGLRRYGSAALDLAFIAAGRFEVFLEDGLNAWDMAAGQLLVREAGGVVCQVDGRPFDLNNGGVLATNPKLLPQALRYLR